MVEVTMAKNNNDDSLKDNILKDMLSFKVGEVTVNKIIFEESDEEFLPDFVTDLASPPDKQDETAPCINNVIILGTKKINTEVKTTDTETFKNIVNIKTEKNITDSKHNECEVDNDKISLKSREPHQSWQPENNRSKNKENTERFGPNQVISIPMETLIDFEAENDGTCFQDECAEPFIFPEIKAKETHSRKDEFEIEKITAENQEEITKNTVPVNRKASTTFDKILEIDKHGVSVQKPVLNENVTQRNKKTAEKERKTFGLNNIISNTLDNTISSTSQNETTATPCEDKSIDPILIPDMCSLEDDEPNKPKRCKTNLPRTKVTSKREISENPGIMEAMRCQAEESKIETMETAATSATTKHVNLYNSSRSSVNSSSSVVNYNDSNVNLKDPYVLSMLTAAVENLLAIFPTLSSFITVTKTVPKTDEAYKKVKSEFDQLKYDCFNLSYVSTISIIIPNKDNKAFLKEFYNLAVKLAKEKQTSCFSIQNFDILCNELIHWTQYKQKKIESLHTNSIIQKHQQSPASLYTTEKKNAGQPKKLHVPPEHLGQMPVKNSIESSVPRSTNKCSTSVANYQFKAGLPGREIEITYNSHSQPQTRAINFTNYQSLQNTYPVSASLQNVSGYNVPRQTNVALESNNQSQPRRNMSVTPNKLNHNNKPNQNTTVSHIPNLVINSGHQDYQASYMTPNKPPNNASYLTQNSPANPLNYMDIFIESLLQGNDKPAKKARSARHQRVGKDSDNRAYHSSVTNQNNPSQNGANTVNSQSTVYHQPPPTYPMPPPAYPMPSSQPNWIYQNVQTRFYPLPNNCQIPERNHEYQKVTPIQQYSKAIYPPVLAQERSSVSRDSGVISPLDESNNNFLDQMESLTNTASSLRNANTVEPQLQMSSVQVPVITHVTSLDPSATYSPNGNCQVCNKVTKYKCLACNLSYYCQYECQIYDWPLHSTYCTGYQRN